MRARQSSHGAPVLLLVLGLAWQPSAAGAQVSRSGADHAVLINGGDRPESNYYSHLEHLREMVAVLVRRGIPAERIYVFSADGEDPAPDLTTRQGPPADFWLIADTAIGKRLMPATEIIDTPWRGVRLYQARVAVLRQWFDAARTAIPPGDRLLLFVTDHGGRGGGDPLDGTISLWQERLTVRELRSLLDRLSPGVQVVTAMSQCYSGAFAHLMYSEATGEPSGNTCGVFSTSSEDKAYGCYPEANDKDRIGHAFEFIAALGQQASVADAHAQVLLSDNTPDRPRRTSDVFLARLISDEARARGLHPDDLTDLLLAAAWRRASEWEPEIRLLDAIADAFGTFSPRSLRELKSREQDLTLLAEQVNTQKTRWKGALNAAKEATLRDFFKARPTWSASLDKRAINELAPTERALQLDQLLLELVPFAAQSANWPKLQQFQDAARRAAEAGWRFEVRRAAADRMKTILVRIAGRELLSGADQESGGREHMTPRAAQHQALEALLQCEAAQPGELPVQARGPAAAREPFPSIADETALLEELRPSWFGVKSASVSAAVRKIRPSLAGAAQVQEVEDFSPAFEAGLAAGDVLLGPLEQPFKDPRDLQDWIMMSPREMPLQLAVFRPGTRAGEHREFSVSVYLRAYPAERPESGVPPRPGARAPALRDTLKALGEGELPDVSGREHLLFFWATWCAPCKAAAPEVMAFAAARGIQAVAITDEDEAVVSKFLGSWTRPFFDVVAVDAGRKTFISYAVSGTPTVVLVDADGIVRLRQVGYLAKDGLKIEGWRWRGR